MMVDDNPHAWTEDAACIGLETDMFFPRGQHDPNIRKVCGSCPVAAECLAAAMIEERGKDRFHRHGMRGGLTPKQRADLAKAVY